MNRAHVTSIPLLLPLVGASFALGLGACGSASKSAESPPKSPAPSQESAPAAYPAQAPDARAESSAPSALTPGAGASAPPADRKIALGRAAADIEASQRELDFAGSNCQSACRALGSMDRAAGHLCSLAQTDDEARRCGDARTKLYSARDKVKGTCGSCPDVSVERNAPVPSRER